MHLFERITTLIKADAHGVVESIEDRRLLAKQLVRDAKVALDAKRTRIAELRSHQERLTQESKRLVAVMARLDEDVALAMERRNDELARAAIRKLLPLREADRRLNARLVTVHDEESRSIERLALQEQELEILKTRLQAELAAEAAGRTEESFERPVITEDDVELELLRRRQAADSAAAQQPRSGVE